jgi:hypothetical protein
MKMDLKAKVTLDVNGRPSSVRICDPADPLYDEVFLLYFDRDDLIVEEL